MNIYQQQAIKILIPLRCRSVLCKTPMRLFGMETAVSGANCFRVLSVNASPRGPIGVNKRHSIAPGTMRQRDAQYRFYSIKKDGHVGAAGVHVARAMLTQ